VHTRWTVVAVPTAAAVIVVALVVLEERGLAERNETLPKRNGGSRVIY
jgi:hypothetical protein